MASLSLPSNPLMKTDTVGVNLPIEVEYTQEDYEEALFRGYTVVDPATVITTHITEVIKDNIGHFGGSQALL